MMPEMDGFEFMAQLQANPDWQRIPVFVVTALDLSERIACGSTSASGRFQQGKFQPARTGGANKEHAAGGGNVMRVLYVEDNEDNVYVVKMRLELIEGFEIDVAKDGAEAVAMVAAKPPDLILMDLNLAGDGRVGGDETSQGRYPDGKHPGHRAYGARDVGRPGAGDRGGLRRLRYQADRF